MIIYFFPLIYNLALIGYLKLFGIGWINYSLLEKGIVLNLFFGFLLNILHKTKIPLLLNLCIVVFLLAIIGKKPELLTFVLLATFFLNLYIYRQNYLKNLFNWSSKLVIYLIISLLLVPVGSCRWYNTGVPFQDEIETILSFSSDNLFHAAYSAIFKNYMISSTGLHGVTPTSYHILTHIVFSIFSKSMNTSVIESYATFYQTSILPLLFMSVFILKDCIVSLHKIKPRINFLSNTLVALLLIGVINNIDDGASWGSKYGIGNGLYASQSYTLGCCFSLIFIASVFDNKIKHVALKNLYYLFSIFILICTKVSALLCVFILLFKNKIIYFIILCVLLAIYIFYKWGPLTRQLNLGDTFFDVATSYYNITTDQGTLLNALTTLRFIFVHYFYFFVFSIWYLFLYVLKREQLIRPFFGFISLIFFISLIIIAVVPAKGPHALLGAAHLFFSEPVNLFSIAGISSSFAILYDNQKLKKILIVFFAIIAFITFSNLSKKIQMFEKQMQGMSNISSDSNRMQIASTLVAYRKLGKETLIYVPKSNKKFWDSWDRNWSQNTLPFLIPAVSEHPGLFTLPDISLERNKYAKLYTSYMYYQERIFKLSESDQLSDEILKSETLRQGFSFYETYK